MHKLYLLLRNNKKQGPYSLEELVQQTLKPFDLVWVEGKSVGWKYPTEIDELKTYVGEPVIETKVTEPSPVIESISVTPSQKPIPPPNQTQPPSQPQFQPKPPEGFR